MKKPADSPELRRIGTRGHWSIIAQGRSQRPRSAGAPSDARRCHFCPGNEGETEPEIHAVRSRGSLPNAPGWKIRVVRNKYPALDINASSHLGARAPYRWIAGAGVHEVVIETPEHDKRLEEFPVADLTSVLQVYQNRLRSVSRNRSVRCVAIFRNVGHAAGASQEHPHAQVLALPVVSARLEGEVAAARQYFRRHGRCLTCDAIASPAARDLHVATTSGFVVLTSFAPRFAYETWIVPAVHQHDFRDVRPAGVRRLAAALQTTLQGLRTLLGPLAYNLVLQTAPVNGRSVTREFHWRFEIIPRLSIPSGFELGSDVFIVDVSPEDAASRLRTVFAESRPRKTKSRLQPSIIRPQLNKSLP